MMRLTSLAAKWNAYARKPFPLLVRLSIDRIVHGSNASEDEELNINFGVVLALLAIPGGFASIFLFDKYGSFLQWLRGQTNFDPLAAAFSDEYFFIVLSMAVAGGVAVWWWDSIFPDRRDFHNLVHLPVPMSKIFLANSVAVLILTSVCAIDVNGASAILFPFIVGGAQPTFSFMARFAGVHALVVVLASIFSFFAVFATAGLLMLVLPYPLFRRVSLLVRSALAALLLAMLSTSFAVPDMIRDLPRSPHSPVRLLPSAWFVGFCQLLRGRFDPALAEIGHLALIALLCVCAVAVITYALAYRRCFVRLPELADVPRGNVGTWTSVVYRVFDFFIFRTPFQRAGYRFAVNTVLRNEAHAMCTGGFLSLGAVFASQEMVSALSGKGVPGFPTAHLLSIPLILGYCLLLGIRFVFDIPAYIQANWIFRFLLDEHAREAGALARRIMLCFVACILLAALPIYVYFWGWLIAVLHGSLVAIWLLLLTETLLVGFSKVPFTCTYPPFHPAAVVYVIACALGYFGFTVAIPVLEAKALADPVAEAAFLAVTLGAWYAVHRLRTNSVEVNRQLIFEDAPANHFELLNLSDGGL